MEGVYEWAKQHPWAAGLLTLGAIFILLWLLGFFGSSSSSSTSSSGNNLAAAYYAAEAAQTTAGTQLQMATEYYTNQTAQDQIQANAAQGIATTQANMYTTIGGQNASAATTINAADNATAAAYYNDQLLATNNSNNDALAAANTAASFAYQTAAAGYQAGTLNNYISSVISPELASQAGQAAGGGAFITPFGTFNSNVYSLGGGPTNYEALGYSPQDATALALGANPASLIG